MLPAEFCRRDRIRAGDEFDVKRLACGEYRLVGREPVLSAGAVAWLTSCPEKDYFQR